MEATGWTHGRSSFVTNARKRLSTSLVKGVALFLLFWAVVLLYRELSGTVKRKPRTVAAEVGIITTESESSPTCRVGMEKQILVLLYTPPGRIPSKWFPPGRITDSGFGVRRCAKTCVSFRVSTDSRLLPKAEMVLFRLHFGVFAPLPPKPSDDVIYVLSTLEPSQLWRRPPDYLQRFNLLWTYNRNQILSASYFASNRLNYKSLRRPVVPFSQKQKALVSTLISNCEANSGRNAFHKALMSHMEIHNYGRCFRNRKPPSNAKALVNRLATYKFSVAIENSLCTDYITEKFWRAYKAGSVPLVASGNGVPDYSALTASKHSYIDVLSGGFRTVADVAKKLKEIGENEDLYSQYLSYRSQPVDEWPASFRAIVEEAAQPELHPLCRLSKFFLTADGQKYLANHVAQDNETCIPPGALLRHFHLQDGAVKKSEEID